MPVARRANVGTNRTLVGSTSCVVNKSSGAVQGDLLAVVIGSADLVQSIAPPDGTWTQQAALVSTTGAGQSVYLFTKVCGAAEPASWTFTISTTDPAPNYWSNACLALYDGDGLGRTASLYAEATLEDVLGPSLATTQILPIGLNQLVYSAFVDDNLTTDPNYTAATPAGLTKLVDNPAGGNLGFAVFEEVQAVAGATTHTVTQAGGGNNALGAATVIFAAVLDGTWTFQIAFPTGVFAATPTWSDVTDYLLDGEFHRQKRAFELDQIDAGGGRAILDNADRRFEPGYTGSPYTPNVRPLRKAQLARAQGDMRYLWTGYVDMWPPGWDRPAYSTTTIQLLDVFELLERKEITGSFPQEATGARIARILDTVGFPTADRALDSGQSQVLARTILAGDKVTALQHIREVIVTEGPTSAFFVDGQGWATFHDRHRRFKPPYLTSTATFGDGAGEIPYESILPTMPKDLILNQFYVTREGGVTQTASDATSITDYGPRSRSYSTLHTNDDEPYQFAVFAVSHYKDATLRFDEITVKPLANTSYWLTLSSLKFGDRVTVKRRPGQHPAGAGGVVSQDCHVEGITWTMPRGETGDSLCTLQLSPIDPVTYWILGDATYGVLGTTTRLCY